MTEIAKDRLAEALRFWPVAVVFVVWLMGYAELQNRVESIEKKVDAISVIDGRLIRIEEKVDWLVEKDREGRRAKSFPPS